MRGWFSELSLSQVSNLFGCSANFHSVNYIQLFASATWRLHTWAQLPQTTMSAWSRSVVSNSLTLWMVAHQASLSMAFSRQEHWNGLSFPPPGDLPDSGIEPTSLMSPALAGGFFIAEPWWKPQTAITVFICYNLGGFQDFLGGKVQSDEAHFSLRYVSFLFPGTFPPNSTFNLRVQIL